MSTTTTPAAKKTQNVVATSAIAKQFIEDEAASHKAANKGGDITNASNREITDAMVRFVESNREQTRPITDEAGNITGSESFDAFEVVVMEVLGERLENVRVNSAKAENDKLREQLAAMQAQLAKLTAGDTAE